MKNTDPPDSNTLPMKITPELSKFIEGMGLYFQNQGVPRIGGRILALLMISHDPLSAEDIGATLRVSRGSISTNMRILIAGGLVEKVSIPGQRLTLFRIPADRAGTHDRDQDPIFAGLQEDCGAGSCCPHHRALRPASP